MSQKPSSEGNLTTCSNRAHVWFQSRIGFDEIEFWAWKR